MPPVRVEALDGDNAQPHSGVLLAGLLRRVRAGAGLWRHWVGEKFVSDKDDVPDATFYAALGEFALSVALVLL